MDNKLLNAVLIISVIALVGLNIYQLTMDKSKTVITKYDDSKIKKLETKLDSLQKIERRKYKLFQQTLEQYEKVDHSDYSDTELDSMLHELLKSIR